MISPEAVSSHITPFGAHAAATASARCRAEVSRPALAPATRLRLRESSSELKIGRSFASRAVRMLTGPACLVRQKPRVRSDCPVAIVLATGRCQTSPSAAPGSTSARYSASAPTNTQTGGTSVPHGGRPTRGRLTRRGLESSTSAARSGFRTGSRRFTESARTCLRDRRLCPLGRDWGELAGAVCSRAAVLRARCPRPTRGRSRVYRDW
jgi:hypothetical protein